MKIQLDRVVSSEEEFCDDKEPAACASDPEPPEDDILLSSLNDSEVRQTGVQVSESHIDTVVEWCRK